MNIAVVVKGEHTMKTCDNCFYQKRCYSYIKFPDMEYCKHFIDKKNVVKVVRCKDCKYYWSQICSHSIAGGNFSKHNENDFCSYGERKDNENL